MIGDRGWGTGPHTTGENTGEFALTSFPGQVRHGAPRPTWRAALVATLLAVSLSSCSSETPRPSGEQPATTSAARVESPAEPPTGAPDWPRWGFTHTQFSVDDERPPAGDRADSRVPAGADCCRTSTSWAAARTTRSPSRDVTTSRSLDRRIRSCADSGGPGDHAVLRAGLDEGRPPGSTTDWSRRPGDRP